MSKTPRILVMDIESSPMITATFSLWPDSIDHNAILQDWYVICAAWKYLDKPTVYSTSLLDDSNQFEKDPANDVVVLAKIREVMQEADVIIGHNFKKFDYRKINARLIEHGMEPLPSGIQILDTLSEIKKVASFSSNRLDHLGKVLVGDGKIPTEKGLWLKVLKGDKQAVKDMTEYCKGDVKLLEDVYLRIRPYLKNSPHLGVLHGESKYSCPKCGCGEMEGSKIRYSAAGVKKIQKQCSQCFAYSTFTYKDSEIDEKKVS